MLRVLTAFVLVCSPLAGFAQSTDLERREGPLQGMVFVQIPAGTFDMGSSDTDWAGIEDERPQHTVTIQPFEMMTTEVTQTMWTIMMGENPSQFGPNGHLPVEKVSWEDVQQFLARLNAHDPGKGYRLPTEAEWEYACRAGTTSQYFCGNAYGLDSVAWYERNANYAPEPVGTLQPNAWGLFDMIGNVSEFCEDWYHDSYEGAPTDGSAWLEPAGQYRVTRGGAYFDPPFACRSRVRNCIVPTTRMRHVGLRLVRSITD